MKNAWHKYDVNMENDCEFFCREYIEFLSACKTERECVDWIVRDAQSRGYRDLDQVIRRQEPLRAGDKVYRVNMGKSVILYRVGTEPLERGMHILGAHLDAPRIDIKPNPLYENGGFAYLDTHYYGGIKKYQWVTIPLAIHGVIVKKDGTRIAVSVGEAAGEPVFFISDLLAHLSNEQLTKTAAKVIEGEALDIIVGSRPLQIPKKEGEKESAGEEAIKKGILKILKKRYDIGEEDFISAELEAVPAGAAREAGLDQSMILGYGHDDRVCAYTSYRALLDAEETVRTACLILVDKEEIGNVGATGMESRFFENTTAEVMDRVGGFDELKLRRCLANSCMLSNDVSSTFDPLYGDCFDKRNAAYFGGGLAIAKYSGVGGKGGANDANAEYLARLRAVFDEADISYQMAEFGRVDLGGGGTISYILSLYGMEVIDCGVPVLNMHAPWEAVSKADVFEAARGYKAFLEHRAEIG